MIIMIFVSINKQNDMQIFVIILIQSSLMKMIFFLRRDLNFSIDD
jgi:hypothetical protein